MLFQFVTISFMKHAKSLQYQIVWKVPRMIPPSHWTIQKIAQEQPTISRKEICPTIPSVSNVVDHVGQSNASQECDASGAESRYKQ